MIKKDTTETKKIVMIFCIILRPMNDNIFKCLKVLLQMTVGTHFAYTQEERGYFLREI